MEELKQRTVHLPTPVKSYLTHLIFSKNNKNNFGKYIVAEENELNIFFINNCWSHDVNNFLLLQHFTLQSL